uniref:Annexin n=1 Tax=Canis lupus familiaris TaxID=9615 RepID=A0A8C0YZQ0_CANLF
MQGARCRTLSRVSRITPWAEGGAKPLRHPGWAVHLFILTTDYSSKLSFIKGLGLVCKIGSDPGRGFEISYRGCQRAACITERAMEEVTTDPFCLLRNTLGKWSSKLHPFSIPRSLPPCPWAQGPSRLARSEPARAATQQLRPPFLRPRREEEPQGPTARSPARSPHALPAALWRQRPLRLPGGGRTPAARPRTRGAPRRRTEAGEGAGRARGAGRGVRGRGAREGRGGRAGGVSAAPRALAAAARSLFCSRPRPGSLRGSARLGPGAPSVWHPPAWTRAVAMAQVLKGTVTPFPGFDERADAEVLRKAMKGLGTDEESILTLLTSRSNAQRQEIAAAFKTLFGRDLLDDLKSELTGKFEKLIVALMKPSRLYDAYELKHALKALFQAGELKWGTDEEKFITIFGTRSVSHLRRVFDKYMTISGFQIEETIDRETSGNLEQLLLAVVKSIRSIPAYLAETLYYAMKGAGTDDHTLIRVVVSRSEIDLFNIRKEFRKNFATSLYSMIKGDTSGDYKKALLMLCGGEDD